MANTTGRKFGGRVKGTPNRSTVETKELLQKIVGEELDKLGTLLNKLDPSERVNAIAKLLPYILPKQSEIKAEVTTTVSDLTDEQRDARIEYLKNKMLELKI